MLSILHTVYWEKPSHLVHNPIFFQYKQEGIFCAVYLHCYMLEVWYSSRHSNYSFINSALSFQAIYACYLFLGGALICWTEYQRKPADCSISSRFLTVLFCICTTHSHVNGSAAFLRRHNAAVCSYAWRPKGSLVQYLSISGSFLQSEGNTGATHTEN